MSQPWDDPRLMELAEAIRRQTEVSERIAQSLARLEALTALENERREADRREQAQDRAEARIRIRQLDGQMGGFGRGSVLMNLTFILVVVMMIATLFHLFRN